MPHRRRAGERERIELAGRESARAAAPGRGPAARSGRGRRRRPRRRRRAGARRGARARPRARGSRKRRPATGSAARSGVEEALGVEARLGHGVDPQARLPRRRARWPGRRRRRARAAPASGDAERRRAAARARATALALVSTMRVVAVEVARAPRRSPRRSPAGSIRIIGIDARLGARGAERGEHGRRLLARARHEHARAEEREPLEPGELARGAARRRPTTTTAGAPRPASRTRRRQLGEGRLDDALAPRSSRPSPPPAGVVGSRPAGEERARRSSRGCACPSARRACRPSAARPSRSSSSRGPARVLVAGHDREGRGVAPVGDAECPRKAGTRDRPSSRRARPRRARRRAAQALASSPPRPNTKGRRP